MSEGGVVTRRFVYAGRLLTSKGTLVHAWMPEEGIGSKDAMVRFLPKAKGGVVGGIYTIDVKDKSYFPDSVSWHGEKVNRELLLELEAEAHAAGVRHAQKALERNASRSSEIKVLCKPLRELVRKQVGWANQSALLAFITNEIAR